MLYFLYGTDTNKTITKGHDLVDILLKKRPGASVFKMDSDSWNSGSFEELIESQGLFERKFVVYINGVLENTDAKDFILGRIKEIAGSDNAFILREAKIDAQTAKKLEKQADKTLKYDEKSEGRASKGKPDFSFTDAFASRDRKKLWILYRQKIDAGEVPEMIHGSLFWQLKSMIVAGDSESAKEAGMKEWPYSKGKSASEKWGRERLLETSSKLVSIYHDSHRGKHDLKDALERFILEL